MPRLRGTRLAEKKENFSIMAKNNMMIHHMTTESLSKVMGVKPSTLYAWLSEPRKMNYEILTKMFDVLHFTDEEKLRCI